MTITQAIADFEAALAAFKASVVETTPAVDGWLDVGPFRIKESPNRMIHCDAEKWAADQGGALPTREQGKHLTTLKNNPAFAHLFNREDSFPAGFVWLAETLIDFRDYAWCQRLSVGAQSLYFRYLELPVLCVRR